MTLPHQMEQALMIAEDGERHDVIDYYRNSNLIVYDETVNEKGKHVGKVALFADGSAMCIYTDAERLTTLDADNVAKIIFSIIGNQIRATDIELKLHGHKENEPA